MPVLTLAVLTMTAAQLLDLVTFAVMVRRLGVGAEINPIVLSLVNDYGLPMAGIAKVALMAFITAIVLILASRTRRLDRTLGALVLGLAIVGGIVAAGTNVLTMGPL